MNKEIVIQKIQEYLDSLNIKEEDIKNRIHEMYIKELIHIIEMKESFMKIEKISKYSFLNYGRMLQEFNDIKMLETDDDFFAYTVNTVNSIFSDLFGSK